MRRFIERMSLLLLVAVFSFAWGQDLPTIAPDERGFSAERLERIAEAQERYVAEGRAAGTVALISRGGQIVYFEAFGMRDREAGAPMEKDTIFRIYSMTKPITSVAAMILHEEGRFLLQDPVSKYLPELGGLDVFVGQEVTDSNIAVTKVESSQREMTIHDLLRHTSGLTYGVAPTSQVDRMYLEAGALLKDSSLQETVEKLGKLPLLYQPGTVWHYGVSTDVLARLVEVVSGKTFDVFLRERIFEPLGMADTFFELPLDKKDRFAQLYTADAEGQLTPNPDITRSYMGTPGHFSGGAGLLSTAADYWRFCQMLLNGGQSNGAQILSPKTVQLMSKNNLGDIKMGFGRADASGFGLGFQVELDLGRSGTLGSEGEYSWGGAAGTRFWIDPSDRVIGIYMIQILPHTGLTFGNEFKVLAEQALVTSGRPIPARVRRTPAVIRGTRPPVR